MRTSFLFIALLQVFSAPSFVSGQLKGATEPSADAFLIKRLANDEAYAYFAGKLPGDKKSRLVSLNLGTFELKGVSDLHLRESPGFRSEFFDLESKTVLVRTSDDNDQPFLKLTSLDGETVWKRKLDGWCSPFVDAANNRIYVLEENADPPCYLLDLKTGQTFGKTAEFTSVYPSPDGQSFVVMKDNDCWIAKRADLTGGRKLKVHASLDDCVFGEGWILIDESTQLRCIELETLAEKWKLKLGESKYASKLYLMDDKTVYGYLRDFEKNTAYLVKILTATGEMTRHKTFEGNYQWIWDYLPNHRLIFKGSEIYSLPDFKLLKDLNR